MTELISKAKRILELAEKATPGPWLNAEPNHPDSNFRLQIGGATWPMNIENAKFIAESRTTAPELATALLKAVSMNLTIEETIINFAKAMNEAFGAFAIKRIVFSDKAYDRLALDLGLRFRGEIDSPNGSIDLGRYSDEPR